MFNDVVPQREREREDAEEKPGGWGKTIIIWLTTYIQLAQHSTNGK